MDCGVAYRTTCGLKEFRNKTDAVFSRIVRQLCADNIGRRCHEIVQADSVLVFRSGRYSSRPASDQRYAVPPFIDTSLRFAERLVSALFRTIVTGGDDQCVLAELIAIKGIHDLSQHRVTLINPVAVFRIVLYEIDRMTLSLKLR